MEGTTLQDITATAPEYTAAENTTGATATAADDVRTLTSKRRTDHHIWGTYIFIVLISVIELFSASIQEVTPDDIYGPIIRHVFYIGLGLVIMLVLQKIHFRYIYFCIPLFVICSILAMIIVNFAGTKVNGELRAISLGPIFILPAEFLKLATALGVAWILSRCQLKDRHDVTERGFWWCLGFLFVCCGLLFFHGLTNTILVAAIGVAMMFVGGVGGKKFLLALLIMGAVGGTGVLIKTTYKSDDGPTEQQIKAAQLNKEDIEVSTGHGRGATWNGRLSRHFRSDKYKDPITDENKQEQLSYIAQAHGGVFGAGIGNSRENARLPLAVSDYIYAIVIEELGLIVGIVLLFSYVWLLGRSARLMMCFRQTLPGVLVIGCAFVIVFQALVHMAIVTGFFPVSGQPLPLISKGGTSIIATSIAFGIMLSVSRHAARYNDSNAVRQEIEVLPDNVISTNPSMLDIKKN